MLVISVVLSPYISSQKGEFIIVSSAQDYLCMPIALLLEERFCRNMHYHYSLMSQVFFHALHNNGLLTRLYH